jgi:hypothetical protein
MKHTPLSFFFPERSLFLSTRCTENPAAFVDGDSISGERNDSVKEYDTVPDVSLEGDPHPELIYFIVQRLNISE